MFRSTGIDLGTTGTREVSVGLYWGGPREGNGSKTRTVSVASDLLTFRRIILPPANRQMCRQVVQEELAFTLPFPVDQASFDYTGERGGEAWVVVAPNDRLEPVRREVGEEALLDAEPLSYLRACMAMNLQSALVIDFGASRTTFCGVVAGRIDWVRVMLRGGIYLTKKLGEKLKLTPEQAESVKCTKGLELRELKDLMSDLLQEAMVPAPLPYDEIVVCGGGAAMPGLSAFLKDRLKAEAALFPIPEPLSPYEHVSAFGAALSQRPRQPRVRLEDARVTAEQEAGNWRTLAIWVVLLLLMVVADLEMRHYTLQQRYEQVKSNLSIAVQPVLKGELPPDQILDRLKKQIAYGQQVKGSSVKHLMDTISRISGALKQMPEAQLRSIVVDMENNHVGLKGEAASIKQSESLKEALAKIFPELQLARTRTGAPGRVQYELEGKVPAP